MQIQGLQKMTLLDFPGRVACTVFLAGCQFRCPFCHNSELLGESEPGIMDDAQLLKFLESRRGILEGVAFTGGEPLMRKELPALLAKIKELGYPIKLDTNGALPERLKEVVSAGLVDYVAMDIKNSPARYAQTCGLPDMGKLLARVEESKNFLLESESAETSPDSPFDYEFRTTCVAQLHDAASFEAIGPWIRGAKRYFLQVFTDRETVPFAGLTAPSPEEMRAYADIVRPFVGDVQIRGGE
ncbi:MAG: anaerobic ribonucleoside-triphosphate reductase activating protein [Clostridia bacterium]|nr:anaerobic ribonucleoside-triphosphate reductase activating protein [Clostridia bacterium]